MTEAAETTTTETKPAETGGGSLLETKPAEGGDLLTGEHEDGETAKPQETQKQEDTKEEDYGGLAAPEDIKDKLGELVDVAKANKVPKAGVEAILAKVAEVYSSKQLAKDEAAQAETKAKQDEWKAAVLKDPQAKQIVSDANWVLKNMADQDTINALVSAGLGNHPGIVRLLASVAKPFKEDGWKGGGKQIAEPKPAHQVIYTSHYK